jgi:hypothetical protein
MRDAMIGVTLGRCVRIEKIREVQALRIMKEPTDDLTRIELVDLAQATAEVA